jgi:NADH oxidase (H2O2-forming)
LENWSCKEEALENGFEPIESKIEDITRAGYYPDNKKIWIKLVADKKNKRILGAQIVGGEAVKGKRDFDRNRFAGGSK